jgi:cell division protein FtsI (penicillin-binding protein 3)
MPLQRTRFWLVCLVFLCWALLIAARLFWLQVVRHQEFMERAEKQQQRTFEVAPRRGILYDRNQRELAITVQVDSIFAVPSEIGDKQAAARALAALVHTDPDDAQSSEEQIAARLQAGRSFAWIARRVTPEIAARVKTLIDSGTLKGIYFQKEFQRFYPDNEIAAQVLGYVGLDDNGLGGLEQKFEPQLHGVPGRMYTALDARRHVLGSSESEPQPGQNLTLTIDENIQFLAERALDHAMQSTQAASGTAVPFAPPSTPTSSAAPRRSCCATTPSATSTSPARSSSWSPIRRRWSRAWPSPTIPSTARAARSPLPAASFTTTRANITV